jgi:hypothetical protein
MPLLRVLLTKENNRVRIAKLCAKLGNSDRAMHYSGNKLVELVDRLTNRASVRVKISNLCLELAGATSKVVVKKVQGTTKPKVKPKVKPKTKPKAKPKVKPKAKPKPTPKPAVTKKPEKPKPKIEAKKPVKQEKPKVEAKKVELLSKPSAIAWFARLEGDIKSLEKAIHALCNSMSAILKESEQKAKEPEKKPSKIVDAIREKAAAEAKNVGVSELVDSGAFKVPTEPKSEAKVETKIEEPKPTEKLIPDVPTGVPKELVPKLKELLTKRKADGVIYNPLPVAKLSSESNRKWYLCSFRPTALQSGTFLNATKVEIVRAPSANDAKYIFAKALGHKKDLEQAVDLTEVEEVG